MTQHTQIGEFAGRPRLEARDNDHTAHWETHGDGHWSGDFVVYGKGRVGIDIREYGRRSRKRVMVTLDPKTARELVAFLTEHLSSCSPETYSPAGFDT